eukprot:scaffold108057_cov37-Tisochrysis_lutea.AAC.4
MTVPGGCKLCRARSSMHHGGACAYPVEKSMENVLPSVNRHETFDRYGRAVVREVGEIGGHLFNRCEPQRRTTYFVVCRILQAI